MPWHHSTKSEQQYSANEKRSIEDKGIHKRTMEDHFWAQQPIPMANADQIQN